MAEVGAAADIQISIIKMQDLGFVRGMLHGAHLALVRTMKSYSSLTIKARILLYSIFPTWSLLFEPGIPIDRLSSWQLPQLLTFQLEWNQNQRDSNKWQEFNSQANHASVPVCPHSTPILESTSQSLLQVFCLSFFLFQRHSWLFLFGCYCSLKPRWGKAWTLSVLTSLLF